MATDTKTADSSVMMALSELARMEQDRIESDRARDAARARQAREELERAEAGAREAERQATERARRDATIAEAEARMRIEADRERDQRIAAMRAELARVESERQTLRADLETRVMRGEPTRTNGWALAFGLSSLVAASLAGLLVVQQSQTAAQPMPLVAHAPVVAAAPELPVTHEVAPVAAPEHVDTVARIDPTPRIRAHHRHGDRTQQTEVDAHPTGRGTDIVGLGPDDNDDDVLTPDLLRDAQRSLQH